MSLKLHLHSFPSSSSSDLWLSRKSIRTRFLNRRVVDSEQLMKRCCIMLSILENGNLTFSCRLVDSHNKSRRIGPLLPCASADDGLTVNGSPQTSSSDLEETRVKLDKSILGEDYSAGLVQALYDAARVFEWAIKEQISLSTSSWFDTTWLGVDKTAWVKALSYQASVYSLLQAASEISFRGDGRYRDLNILVEKSLSRHCGPLESLIRETISDKQPEVYDWFWSEQVPVMVTSFVNYFEKDQRSAAATVLFGKGMSIGTGTSSDRSLLMLALCCIAAIRKLGPTKVFCAQFFTMIPDIAGRLMDVLIELVPIRQAYHFIEAIGLHREFLVHFGVQAAACRVKNDRGTEEVAFWVRLVQKQLQKAIYRERIWSRLTTSESIEVLDRDLAIFGFFIALGRSTQSYLSSNGFEAVDEPIEGFIRYLIGGSVLYYPQLSSISSYQLYVEVVCEELDWLPFYPGSSNIPKSINGHKGKNEVPPNADAIPISLDVCSHWIQSFIKYSTWLKSPSNVKAARFLSRGHKKLQECITELGIQKDQIIDNRTSGSVVMPDSGTYSPLKKESHSFNKDELKITNELAKYYNAAEGGVVSKSQNSENIIQKSLDKFKEASTDILQGTQLLAIDVAAAIGLLRRALIGDELTDKEKQAFRRTMIDLASVVPIGFLMLLPVTAVGHAAMLAAIQRYVPSLIPSTYGTERLDLLRQIEKVKQLENTDVNLVENADS